MKYAYFGHPLVDNIKISLNKKTFYKKFNISAHKKIIVLLPGSRGQEVRQHIHYLLETAEILNKKYDDLCFVINIAGTIDPGLIQQYINKYNIPNIRIIKDNIYNLFNASHAGLMVSGTVTLEAAFFDLPMAVIYRVDPLFYILVKYLLIKVRFVSLVNLIANKGLVREILQKDLTTANLVEEAIRLVEDKKYRKEMIVGIRKLRKSLGRRGVAKKIANQVEALL